MTRYELLERIGAGGMAEIFRGKAIAAGGFEKPVAIKRILPHLSQDQRFVELLIAEAKILSQLRHRAVVQIFDVGLGDDGQYFLVMEFVDGVDMGAVQRALETRRKRLPLDLVLHIGAEVCEALEHAHSAIGPNGAPMRLVHRDVSPSNILVSRAGEVKLTDFGIAKRPEEQTGHGSVRGKFAYISPEQAENRHVDARSDVYSLAVVLFELVVGRRLFSQLNDLDALKAVREGKVPRPRELDPQLPSDVEDALLSALGRDPASRVKTAAELGARLRTIRYGLETAAGDPAKELARVVAGMAVQREPEGDRTARGKKARVESGYEVAEPTVLRIRTAAGFSEVDDGASLLRARQVIDRFEEEETRMSPPVPRAWEDDHTTSSGPIAQALAMAPVPRAAVVRDDARADDSRADDSIEEETHIMDGGSRRSAPMSATVAASDAAAARALDGTRALQPRGKRSTLPPPKTAARIAAARAAAAHDATATPTTGTILPEVALPRAARVDSSTAAPPTVTPVPRADGSASNLPRASSTPAQSPRRDARAGVRPMSVEEAARRRKLIKIGGGIAGGIGAIAILAALLAGGGPTAAKDGVASDAAVASGSSVASSAASGAGPAAASGAGPAAASGAGPSTASGAGTSSGSVASGSAGVPAGSGFGSASAIASGDSDGSGSAVGASGSTAGSGTGASSGSGAPVVRRTPPRRVPPKKPPTRTAASKTPVKTSSKTPPKKPAKTSTTPQTH